MSEFISELNERVGSNFALKDFALRTFEGAAALCSEQEQTRPDAKVSAVMDITPPNSDF